MYLPATALLLKMAMHCYLLWQQLCNIITKILGKKRWKFLIVIYLKIYKLKFLVTYPIFDKILISQKASNCEINLKNFTKSQYLFLNPAIF